MTAFHLNMIKIVLCLILVFVTAEGAFAECSVDQIGKMTGAGLTKQEGESCWDSI